MASVNDNLHLIRHILVKKCWSTHTSSDPQNWSYDNLSWGQCAVTALLVQDIFGGEIVRTNYILPDGERGSHYFNILQNGERVDLTIDQFPEGTDFRPPLNRSNEELITLTRNYVKSKGYEGTIRDYILSFEQTAHRFRLLKNAYDGNKPVISNVID